MNRKKSILADRQCSFIKKIESETNEQLLFRYTGDCISAGSEWMNTEQDDFESEAIHGEFKKRLTKLGFFK